ncbi:MAG: PLP-dependent aminotransferase family protein [Chloroflexi bacterium]|nr:PLP-dependent aminotransferase family protein [Chloroflexota bacterium]MBP7041299.1 PLP-dependent aminotransferase family protein [Chloroflexota bacterium]
MILPAPSHEMVLAHWTHTMSRSVLRQMIAITARPGILSFAGGLPDPALFPAADYAAALQHVLTADAKALQYGPPLEALKVHIVGLMAERGVKVTPEQVFLTTGAQQGLDILTRLFLNPGGEVLLEEIVYPGIQQTVAPYRPHILPVPTDLETGIDVDTIEQHLADGARPAFLYVIPDAHNPLGVSISPGKRQRLVSLARAYGLPIIEDDPYGFLHYDCHLERPLRAFDDEWIFYLGSFSKILAPALRLGWMIAPEPLLAKLTVIKEANDLESSALTQRAVAAYLDAGHLPAHLEMLRDEYGRRRDTMLQALYRHFPTDARWTVPSGGMFVWVELSEGVDTKEMLETAVTEAQVAFIPGAAFTIPGHSAPNCLRLNFSNCTPDRIEEGITRLAQVINRE